MFKVKPNTAGCEYEGATDRGDGDPRRLSLLQQPWPVERQVGLMGPGWGQVAAGWATPQAQRDGH